MAVNNVRVYINGVWTTLTLNATTGKYEGTVAAPNASSFNRTGGYYPVQVEAYDKAGNYVVATDTHATLGSSLKLTVKETTKPTITITAPATGAYLSSNTPSITFQLRDEASGSGIKISSLAIKVDSGATITNTSPGVTVTTVTNGYDVTYVPQAALSDGSHTVAINVSDNDNNTASQVSRSFTVDTIPPTLAITSPIDSTSYTNAAAFSLVGSTNDASSSPVTVTIKLNSGTAEVVSVDASGNFTKALTLTSGTNTITIVATDKAGKTSTATRTIILDTVPPVITSIVITPNPVNTGQSYTISVSVTD